MPNETVTHSILKANGALLEWVKDTVVREVPLTIHYNREEIATLLCSPSQTEELTLGFLFSEGFIRIPEDVYEIRHDPSDHMVWVEGKPCVLQKELMSKRFVSACCGKSRASFCFANDALMVKPLTSTYNIPIQEAYDYAKFLQSYLPLFQETGGIHSGGVGHEGNVLLTSYDIGRHNVFDKLSGEAFRTKLNLENHVIFFSGRVSSEILLKVAKMKVPILIARGAPTDMALSQATALNITVIGFAREQRLNIYTCPERILC
ncbi:formate dehydrogenase accessory sulfurtransferase FdhD [Desulfosporosinus sp.]|uniref:formate dehydrogenase accessory sulfurtransferase FdhD n=1 Tax=Desulfosporosinus sp. TaxID=157907 RepID=UPI000E7FCA6C|nr:formate dehydrogenase accessory sulfurtransferase FdhD [Desulfosporosinus sp.]MBC2721472.1 formate dehydrogenase accessory sulfurtransferase FdhD [Desulfosporosinus sp.]MBC2727527.1 formate dehydrogenase accessory sulfurtransferase FdhD [Desulfosporosinus sp.]HBV87758.1 formate dehydrogenase accessory sulfurtransferase FdhD [Desulfosporosinus sp.]